LFDTRHTVTAAEFKTAGVAWAAFCAPEPLELASLLDEDTSALPFLRAAVLRHLQQFPALRNGLARTERQILEVVEAGPLSFPELFLADQKLEESIFMGDLTFRQYLRGMTAAKQALLRGDNSGFEITEFGRRVLQKKEDHVRANGINRWLGGVHLCEGAPVWRWDEALRAIRP